MVQEYQQYEELTQVKIPVYHAAAVACVGLKKFSEGRELIDACLDLIKGSDPYRAFMLLVKCDLLEKEAESIEKDSGKAASFTQVLELALTCAQEARAVLDEHASEFSTHPIFFKPDTCVVSIFLTWGRMDEAEDKQEELLRKMTASGSVVPQRLAFQTDEFADICLDSGKMQKGLLAVVFFVYFSFVMFPPCSRKAVLGCAQDLGGSARLGRTGQRQQDQVRARPQDLLLPGFFLLLFVFFLLLKATKARHNRQGQGHVRGDAAVYGKARAGSAQKREYGGPRAGMSF